MRNKLLVFLFGFLSSIGTYARPDTLTLIRRDSTIQFIFQDTAEQSLTDIDSDQLIRLLKRAAEKNKAGKYINKLVVNNKPNLQPDKRKRDAAYQHLLQQAGKTISQINIQQLPPFGPSLNDTTRLPRTWMEKTGNHLRFKTSQKLIRNNLIFKAGDQVFPAEIIESERLLRDLEFIKDARILLTPSPIDSNSVQLTILVQDVFPHAFNLNVFSSKPSAGIYTKNMFGQGIGISNVFSIPTPDFPSIGYRQSLKLSNFRNYKTDLNIEYIDFYDRNYLTANLHRSFSHTRSHWGGGILIDRSFDNDRINYLPQYMFPSSVKYLYSDGWLGYSFLLSAPDDLMRENLYLMVQREQLTFGTKDLDPLHYPNDLYHGFTVAYSKRSYYKNSYIYQYGKIEDVPYGWLSSFTIGARKFESITEPYIGGYFAKGMALSPNKGYAMGSMFAETFLKNGHASSSTISASAGYISTLNYYGKLKVRHFLHFNYIKGFNRQFNEYLFLEENRNGLPGFTGTELKGKEKLTANLENIYFSPLKLVGFHFIFFTFANAGIIGNGEGNFLKQPVYSGLGAGFRVRNDNLVFNTIQIRFTFFPKSQPGSMFYLIQLNNQDTKEFLDFYPEGPRQKRFQ
jgi:hypothetical protein